MQIVMITPSLNACFKNRNPFKYIELLKIMWQSLLITQKKTQGDSTCESHVH